MGVGVVYLAARALGGASRAGILGSMPCFLAALAAFCLSLSFSSCKKKDGDPSPISQFDVKVDSTRPSRNGGTIKVNVLTDLGWTLNTDQPWMTPATTTKSGNAVVEIAVTQNNDGPPRAGRITVTTI